MDKRGYEPAYQAALMASAGFLGVLIPPSMTGIVYATASNISIADAWMSTLLPGLIIATLYAVVNFFHRRKVEPKTAEPFRTGAYVKNIGVSTKNAFWALMMPSSSSAASTAVFSPPPRPVLFPPCMVCSTTSSASGPILWRSAAA